MATPTYIDVSVTGVGESAWLPLNRWGSALHRIHAEVSGTATFSLVGTQDKVNRIPDASAAEEMAVDGFTGLSATTLSTQNLIYEAIKLDVTAGTGTVRLRVQSEGDI